MGGSAPVNGKHCRLASLSWVIWTLSSSPARAGEGDWSRFRGPNGSGIGEADAIPVTWTEKDYNWDVRLPGPGHSSPVAWGHRVFVTCADPGTATRSLVCLDAADGRTLWRRDDPSRTYGQHADAGYATATPVVDDGGVVVALTAPEEVALLALDLDGRERWRRNLGPFVTLQGSGISPIIVGDMVVLDDEQEDLSLTGGPRAPVGKSSWTAVDRKTGATRWRVERPPGYASYGTPCIRPAGDGRTELVFTSTCRGISGVDPSTGKVLWELDEKFLDRTIASPVIAPGGLVIAGCGAGFRATRYVAVRPDGEGRKPTVVYELNRALPLVPTPLVKDGRLYLWTDDGVVSCLRVADGGLVWRERVDGSYYGSPVWVDHRLYCISREGDVVVLADGDRFEVLARVALGEPSSATPAIAGGVMYLRTRTRLFSLGGKAKR